VFTALADAATLCEKTSVPGHCLADVIVTSTNGQPLRIDPGASADLELRGWDPDGPHPLGFGNDTLAALHDRMAQGFGPDVVYVGGGRDQPKWQRACRSGTSDPSDPSGPIAVIDGRGRVLVSIENGDPDKDCAEYIG
jgi:hypothetical protein